MKYIFLDRWSSSTQSLSDCHSPLFDRRKFLDSHSFNTSRPKTFRETLSCRILSHQLRRWLTRCSKYSKLWLESFAVHPKDIRRKNKYLTFLAFFLFLFHTGFVVFSDWYRFHIGQSCSTNEIVRWVFPAMMCVLSQWLFVHISRARICDVVLYPSACLSTMSRISACDSMLRLLFIWLNSMGKICVNDKSSLYKVLNPNS